MNDEKRMNGLRKAVDSISIILMVILIVFPMLALWRVILCSCILLLITIKLVLSGISKDSKGIAIHSAWYALWLIALIVNLFRI